MAALTMASEVIASGLLAGLGAGLIVAGYAVVMSSPTWPPARSRVGLGLVLLALGILVAAAAIAVLESR